MHTLSAVSQNVRLNPAASFGRMASGSLRKPSQSTQALRFGAFREDDSTRLFKMRLEGSPVPNAAHDFIAQMAFNQSVINADNRTDEDMKSAARLALSHQETLLLEAIEKGDQKFFLEILHVLQTDPYMNRYIPGGRVHTQSGSSLSSAVMKPYCVPEEIAISIKQRLKAGN